MIVDKCLSSILNDLYTQIDIRTCDRRIQLGFLEHSNMFPFFILLHVGYDFVCI